MLSKLLRLEEALQVAEAKSQQQKAAALAQASFAEVNSSSAASNAVLQRKTTWNTSAHGIDGNKATPVAEPVPLKRTVSKNIAERLSNISSAPANNSNNATTLNIPASTLIESERSAIVGEVCIQYL